MILDTICFKVGTGQILSHEVKYVFHLAYKVIACCGQNAAVTSRESENNIMQLFYPSETVSASIMSISSELAQFEEVANTLNAFDALNLSKPDRNIDDDMS
jgi:hypothetical protein